MEPKSITDVDTFVLGGQKMIFEGPKESDVLPLEVVRTTRMLWTKWDISLDEIYSLLESKKEGGDVSLWLGLNSPVLPPLTFQVLDLAKTYDDKIEEMASKLGQLDTDV